MTDEINHEPDVRETADESRSDEAPRFSRLGQQHAQQIVQEAWQEAEEVIAGSQAKAAEIVENGRREAGDIISQSRQAADDIVLTGRRKADEVMTEGKEKANAVIEEARKLAGEVGERIEQEAREQAETILADARQEAKETVRRTEEDLNRQLKEKTRERKEKILAEAKQEAENIVAEARKTAEEEGRRIVEMLQQETQKKLEQETANFQTYAQAQADEIRRDTEKRAAGLLKGIDDDSRHFNTLLTDSIKKYEDILARLKEEVQAETGEMAKHVTATRRDIEKKLTSYNAEDEPGNTSLVVKSPTSSSLWVTLGEPMDDAGLNLYKGRLDLKTLSVVDHRKVRSLKAFLTRVQNIKYIGESSNEEGTVLNFEITEPMPLMEILDNIPDVITSEQSGNNIKLTLN